MAGCGFKAFAALLMLSAVALSALALVGYVTPASSVVLVRGGGGYLPPTSDTRLDQALHTNTPRRNN